MYREGGTSGESENREGCDEKWEIKKNNKLVFSNFFWME